MSDREIMEAKGLGSRRSIHNPNLHKHLQEGWKYKDTKVTPTEYPDAKKHQIISFAKSAIRMIGYVLLAVDISAAVGVLILSEAVGVIEELV